MKWTVLFVVFGFLCCANAGRHESKRLGQVEDAVQYLIREVKELKEARSRQERTGESISFQDEAQLARDTLTALQVESRALSQFDAQMRSLQSSLDQLIRNKYRQTETVESFRRELQSLRDDVEALKQTDYKPNRFTRDAPSDNAVKTLQWLLKSVNQLKADVNQISQNINVQAINQFSEDLRKQTHIMQVELQDLRHKLTEEGLERQRIAVAVTQVRVDFNELTESHRHLISDLTTLNSELHLLREDLNTSAEAREWEGTSVRSNRHGHGLHHKMKELETSVQSLRDSQIHLEHKVNRLQKTSYTADTMDSIEKRFYDINAKVSNFETQIHGSEALLAKLEASHSGVHEHIKMFEEHSDLQSKEIQILIDQLQYNISQAQVQNELSVQHQANTDDKLARLSQSVDLLEDEMEKDRISILTLQNRAMNETVKKCKDETKTQIQDLRIETLEYQIQTLKLRIDVFNTTMENWNLVLSSNTSPEIKQDLGRNNGAVTETDQVSVVSTSRESAGSSEELMIVDDCIVNC